MQSTFCIHAVFFASPSSAVLVVQKTGLQDTVEQRSGATGTTNNITDASPKETVGAAGATGTEVVKWGFAHVDCRKARSKEKFGTSTVRNPGQVTCKACRMRFRVPAGSAAFVAESKGQQFQYRCTTCHGTVISSAKEGDNICKAHTSPSGKPCRAQVRARNGVRVP